MKIHALTTGAVHVKHSSLYWSAAFARRAIVSAPGLAARDFGCSDSRRTPPAKIWA